MNRTRLPGPGRIGGGVANPSPWRRVWHLLGGSFFPVLALFVTRDILFILLGTITALVVLWELVRLASPGVNRWMAARLGLILKRRERFHLTGSTYLLIASLIVFYFFERYVAVTSLLFLSVGDFMAVTIGQRYGCHRLFSKSLEGSLACLAACLLIGVVISLTGAGIALSVVITGAVVATLVELLPIPLDDNLTIPLVSAGVMALAGLL